MDQRQTDRSSEGLVVEAARVTAPRTRAPCCRASLSSASVHIPARRGSSLACLRRASALPLADSKIETLGLDLPVVPVNRVRSRREVDVTYDAKGESVRLAYRVKTLTF